MPDLSDGDNWSEVDANNNNPAPNGWPEGMMPSGVNDAARADRGALKRFWDKINPVQTVTPSGGLYTFTTDNVAYPTAYIEGEVYCFKPGAPSVGGDHFQVNGLGAKPIWKRVAVGTGTGVTPILAQDITAVEAQLIYNAALNAGAGAFVLLNPFIPIHGDGTGGLVANGSLNVGGPLSATGYTSRSGLSGPYQSNVFNVQWTGTAAHLWIDATDQGPLVIGSGGNISAATLAVSGNATVGGTLTAGAASIAVNAFVGGTLTAGAATIAGNASVAGFFAVTGNESVAGALFVTGPITTTAETITGDITASGNFRTTSNGASSGGVSIYATAGAIRTDVAGTAFYAPNGDFVGVNVNVSNNVTAGGQGFKPGGGTWASTSDVRLKEDVRDYRAGLLEILALRPITYRYNGRGGTIRDGKRFVGLSADEVEGCMPEMVGTHSERLDPDDAAPTEIKTLDTTPLQFALINAVRELAARVATLEAKT